MVYWIGLLRATAIVLTLAVCNAAYVMAQEWGDAGPGGWLTTPPSDYPAANSVVVFDRARIQVEIFDEWGGNPKITLSRHIRFMALTRAGVDEIGNFELSFHSKTAFVRFEAQTLCPDGRIVPVAPENILVKELDDYRTRSVAFPGLDSGAIVELRYETKEEYFLTYYPWSFSSDYYTRESRFTLELGCDCQYTYETRNVPPGRSDPVEGHSEGETTNKRYPTYTWRLTNLPPVKAEPYMTSVDDFRAAIMIRLSGIRQAWKEPEWYSMGKSYDDYVGDYVTLPRGFRETIGKITKGLDTKYDKSKAIYNYVVEEFETRQSSYRRSWQHKDMNGLWDKRYGTAWEKNLLLVEMLRKAHIDCWPVLICTRDHARFDPTWKNWDQFSHVIVFVEVEQGGIYLDASSKYCVYGTLPPVCRVDGGLLIDGLNSGLTKVITNDPRSYRLDQTTIRIDAEGNASCSTSCTITGYLAADFGDFQLKAAPERFLSEVAFPGLPNISDDHEDTCWFDSAGRFNVQADYHIPLYAQVVGSALVATSPSFMFGTNPFKSDYRFTNVDFNYAFTYHHVVTLLSEDSGLVVTAPKDLAFNIDGVSFKREAVVTGNSVRVESITRVIRPRFEIGEYPLLREIFRRIEDAAAEPFTWQSKDL